MRIAVLSGKGGTGKTLVSVNLAGATEKSVYIDCDVEEPNGYLYFKPKDVEIDKISVKIPSVDEELCKGCRTCVEFCKFNALAYIKNKLIVFDEVCHACGGCQLLCPEKAISEGKKNIGEIQEGISGGTTVITGILNTGEASGVPIIKELLNKASDEEEFTIIDCPPGSACIVMESIKDADYCVLVAEPTLFGVHNLNMVFELVKLFNKPYGVVLNKCLGSKNPAEEFCKENGIRIIGKIPFDHEIGRINGDASILVKENEKYQRMFSSLLQMLIKEVQRETAINP